MPADWRRDLFKLIRLTPNLNWLVLTKRIGNLPRFLPPGWGDGSGNIWLGATIVNQAEADRDLEKLRAVPASIRFLSIEPLLGPIDQLDLAGIDWVITGGESGPGARGGEGAPRWAPAIEPRGRGAPPDPELREEALTRIRCRSNRFNGGRSGSGSTVERTAT